MAPDVQHGPRRCHMSAAGRRTSADGPPALGHGPFRSRPGRWPSGRRPLTAARGGAAVPDRAPLATRRPAPACSRQPAPGGLPACGRPAGCRRPGAREPHDCGRRIDLTAPGLDDLHVAHAEPAQHRPRPRDFVGRARSLDGEHQAARPARPAAQPGQPVQRRDRAGGHHVGGELPGQVLGPAADAPRRCPARARPRTRSGTPPGAAIGSSSSHLRTGQQHGQHDPRQASTGAEIDERARRPGRGRRPQRSSAGAGPRSARPRPGRSARARTPGPASSAA